METAKVTFHKIHQDSQDFGSDDEHMVSRVFFSVEFAGKRYPNLHVNIKQTVGGEGQIEVGPPQGYSGPFNHDAFSKEVEKYFNGAIGPGGSSFRISGGSARMQDNVVFKEVVVEFPVSF